MVIPYHTHTFEIPTATKDDVKQGTATDKMVTPAVLGDAASASSSDFATQAQGEQADTAVQPDDLGALASKDKIAVPDDINAGGVTDGTTVLKSDSTWARFGALGGKDTITPADTGTQDPPQGSYWDASGGWTVPAGGGGSTTVAGGTGIDVETGDDTATVSLNTASQASLGLADTAVQPGDLGALASKDKIAVPGDFNVTFPDHSQQFLTPLGWGDFGNLALKNNVESFDLNVTAAGTKGQVLTRGENNTMLWDDPQGGGTRMVMRLMQTEAGNYSVEIPDDVTSVFFRIWGAGGAGGKGNSTSSGVRKAGGDGGGGGYAEGWLSVTPGDTLTVTVGSGNPGLSGDSVIASIKAAGGANGTDATPDNSGAGGKGGSVSGASGLFTWNGTAGVDGGVSETAFFSRSGCGWMSYPHMSNRIDGSPGQIFSQGGAAGRGNGNSGGNGADGMIIIQW